MSFVAKNYKKEFRREKILRILIGFAVNLAVALMVGLVFMLPSYFILVFSKDDVLRRLQAAEEVFARKEFKNLEEKIGGINARVSVFEKNESRRGELAPLFRKLAENAPDAVRLVSINVSKDANGFYTMSVQGEAERRDELLKYIDKLESVSEFASVDSPVANLLKETKTLFTLNIKIKPEAYKYEPAK
ncbi:hypothetical protein A3G55_01375 [Candidatus Giovannonibacteria bacterium RIFCSPLOWO2_12_FULL_44_25]|uniref:Fimbrial assembly family protein n=3 Tax=Parcubacteria group TaxID=1794811 RepID=A0A837IKH8_9BACT|nr:MAG: hypothetical protein UW15_C0010G0004 [Parcubacteria group bacterium GW2011_GWC1_44_10]KKT60100.1 MAG: hypothetical protein UW53_C0003G0011 [Candidatus Giovannonibacteria bacterium GW2011_GWA1_44_25]KKU12696.1 MAG: hypothetical protein UX18_C0014G0014 [Candidatus Azambacteria bacterium GW2011_GWC2_45_7b]KKU29947.1 MAG: hypothetical protein UX43_C0003G0040 [Candidatus Giovannonibacteria bacterium GW2011_GWB1_46_20]OGF49305.1 MAG: hypothetical protein A2120_03210 [Candidatus Giovannonibact